MEGRREGGGIDGGRMDGWMEGGTSQRERETEHEKKCL